MHPAELAILLHRALEVRLARLQEGLAPAAWTDDVEQLHQVRVRARRLVTVLDLVDPDAYPGHKRQRRVLKALVDGLGRTREHDVLAAHLGRHHAEARTPLREAVIEHLLEAAEGDRARARRDMLKELEGLRLSDLRRLLEVPSLPEPFQSTSLQAAAWVCLEPRLDRALGDLASLVTQEDPVALHKVRIRIKKLRYAVEALEGAFASAPEGLLRPLRELQAVLGEHHDLATLEALLWEAESRLRAHDRAILCGAVLDLLGDVAEARRTAFVRFTALVEQNPAAAFIRDLRFALGLPPA